MKTNLKKCSILIIAAVLLVAMAFAGTGLAGATIASVPTLHIWNEKAGAYETIDIDSKLPITIPGTKGYAKVTAITNVSTDYTFKVELNNFQIDNTTERQYPFIATSLSKLPENGLLDYSIDPVGKRTANLILDLKGESILKGSVNGALNVEGSELKTVDMPPAGIIITYGGNLIITSSDDKATLNVENILDKEKNYVISAKVLSGIYTPRNITIEAAKVIVSAKSTIPSSTAIGLSALGKIKISKSSDVTATVTNTGGLGVGIAGEALGIDISESQVRADVVSNQSKKKMLISDDGNVLALSKINAKLVGGMAGGLAASGGEISIDKSDVTITVKEDGEARVSGIYTAGKSLESLKYLENTDPDIKISSSTVDVTANAKNGIAIGIIADKGSVKIDGDATKMKLMAVSASVDSGYRCGISARKSVVIDSCAEISTKGSLSSFATQNADSLKIEKLQESYVFSGAKAGEKARSSITYGDLVKEWKQVELTEGNAINVSKYTDVLISKVSTVTLEGISEPIKIVYGSSMVENMPKPTKDGYTLEGWCTGEETNDAHQIVINADGTFVKNVAGYTDANGCWICTKAKVTLYPHWTKTASNRGHSASIPKDYTPSSSVPVMVQETVKPTTAPTLAAPTAMPTTAKPTTQATQKSPAPFIGLIAGLGIAGLVLTRLRK